MLRCVLLLALLAVVSAQDVPPPQGSMTCAQAIKKYECTGTGMACLSCIKKNYKSILNMGMGCTRSIFEQVCGTNSGGSTKCPVALKKSCGDVQGQGDACFKCTTTNSAKLDDADCSNKYIQSYCRGNQAGNDTCPSALEKMCPQVQHQGPSCFNCVRNNTDMLRDAGCSTSSYSQYCRRGPPAPTPANAGCTSELNQICESYKGQGPACYKCIFGNYSSVIKAGCSGRQFHTFCGNGNVQPGCSNALQKYCGAYKGQKYYCFQCVVSNTDDLKAANCSVSNYDQFCEGSSGGNNCTATLKQLCGRQRRNERACTSCVQRNKASTDAAGCTTDNIDNFCNQGGKTPGRTPFAPFGPRFSPRQADPSHPVLLDRPQLMDQPEQ